MREDSTTLSDQKNIVATVFLFLFYCILGVFFLIIQTSPQYHSLFSVIKIKVDLIYIFCLITFSKKNFIFSLLFTSVIGSFVDHISNAPFGIYLTSFILSTSIFPLWTKIFQKIDASVFMLFFLISNFIKILLEAFLIGLFFGNRLGLVFLFDTAILELILNTFASVPLFALSQKKLWQSIHRPLLAQFRKKKSL